ncbi:MAG: helix-turn-helix domain-containing protein, partial [Candidatus Heimdallarchaeota archaeon]
EKEVFRSEKLFKCILGLNEIQANVFSYILKHENVSTMELKEVLDKDRSSIQKALGELIKLKIISRNSFSLKDYFEAKGISNETNDKRGYIYLYSAKDINEIKVEFKDLLDKWYHSMVNYINDLDSLFDCYEIDGKLC